MSSLRNFFLNNIGLKLTSILLAFVLWLTFAAPEPVQRTLSLPIEFVNMASELEIADEYVRQVEVVIRSERSTSTFDARDLAVVIDLRNASSGSQLIPLAEGNIRNRPSGVEILSMTPARVQLKLESTLGRIVEVMPELVGNPAEGFEVTGLESDPSQVMISGPESRVRNVSTARTEPINVEGLSADVTQSAYLDLEDPRLRIENVTSVNVVVTIEEKRQEIRVLRIPVQLLPGDEGTRLLTQTVDILGTTPLSFSGELTAEAFQITIDAQNLVARSEPYEIVPQVTISEDYSEVFELTAVAPELVTLTKSQ